MRNHRSPSDQNTRPAIPKVPVYLDSRQFPPRPKIRRLPILSCPKAATCVIPRSEWYGAVRNFLNGCRSTKSGFSTRDRQKEQFSSQIWSMIKRWDQAGTGQARRRMMCVLAFPLRLMIREKPPHPLEYTWRGLQSAAMSESCFSSLLDYG